MEAVVKFKANLQKVTRYGSVDIIVTPTDDPLEEIKIYDSPEKIGSLEKNDLIEIMLQGSGNYKFLRKLENNPDTEEKIKTKDNTFSLENTASGIVMNTGFKFDCEKFFETEALVYAKALQYARSALEKAGIANPDHMLIKDVATSFYISSQKVRNVGRLSDLTIPS
jgi:hypothetical protein